VDDAPPPLPAPGGVESPGEGPVTPPGPLARLTRALAALALLAYVAATLLLVVPVRNPPVQDCGAPGAYLYQGRVDVVPDGNDQIVDGGEVVTLAPDVADAARATRCQDRVASRAVPAAVLVLGATVVGGGAFAVELLVVRRRRRRALAAEHRDAPPPLPAPPPDHAEARRPPGAGPGEPHLPA